MVVYLQNQNKEEEEITFGAKLQLLIKNYILKFRRISLKERLFFVQYLAVMLKAGISISDALKTIQKQTENKFFQKILLDISARVEKGQSFSESLKNYQSLFSELFINMIETGEMSGKLESSLSQLYIQLKKQHELTSKVKSALTYPIVILFVMIAIGIFLVIVIVPKITELFGNMGAELPLPTKLLIAFSNLLINHGFIIFLIVIVLIILFIKIIKTPKGKYYLDMLLIKMPIIGPVMKKINLARFARTMSSLLKTDIMIVKTLQITGNILGNSLYKKSLYEISEKIKKGGSVSEAIRDYPKLFPALVSEMVMIGEQTGEIESILQELAEFYEGEVDNTMTNLPSIIEPVLLLFLGCGVGVMAVSIIMPMYGINNLIK